MNKTLEQIKKERELRWSDLVGEIQKKILRTKKIVCEIVENYFGELYEGILEEYILPVQEKSTSKINQLQKYLI